MQTLKPTLVACLALVLMAPPALAERSPAPVSAPTVHTKLVRFGGFGRRSFGRPSRGFGARGFGSRRRGTGIFHRIVRAIAIGYLLHLLFTTPGGLGVLLLMVLGIALLMSRVRRRRLRY